MFRVLGDVTELPSDLPANSPEAKALRQASVPNGWVGMASGLSPKDLFWRIDEFVDPYSVELMLAPSGGMCIYSPAHSLLPRNMTEKDCTLAELQKHVAECHPSGLEFTDELAYPHALVRFAQAEAEEADCDLSWAHMFQAYRQSVKDGGWFVPVWPDNVYA